MNRTLFVDLKSYLSNCYPERQRLSVSDFENISDGWESEMYSFRLGYEADSSLIDEKLVLRIYPGDNAIEKAQRESFGMQCLWNAGYPVPRIHLVDSDPDVLGRPFVIMEWIEGRPMWFMLDRELDAKGLLLVRTFSDLFVRLHRLDWKSFAGENLERHTGDPFCYVDAWFERAEGALEQYPLVDFLLVIKWLKARRNVVPCPRPSPVHQDFHPANILVGEDGQAVVIDWTGFDVADFRFDLAWTLMLVYAYSGDWLRNAVLEQYEDQLGDRVEEIETFEVFACVRRLFDVFVSLSEGAQRMGMRPEAVEMMKQHMYATKRVYELLVARTGIKLPDIEALIQSYDQQ